MIALKQGGVPLSTIEGKAAKGSPLNHSSTTVKRPVQEWLLALL